MMTYLDEWIIEVLVLNMLNNPVCSVHVWPEEMRILAGDLSMCCWFNQ